MTVAIANTPDFEFKKAMTSRQATDLLRFISFRSTEEDFADFVQENQRLAPVLYRGIYYPLKNLKAGMAYRHYASLSSWSEEYEVARSFNLDTAPLRSHVEEVFREIGGDVENSESYWNYWEKAVNQFVEVVFEVKNQNGFSVNDFIEHPVYSREKEFILYNGEWTIVDVVETYDVQGRRFYRVILE